MIHSFTVTPVLGEVPHGVDICPHWVLKVFEVLQGVADIAGMTAVSIGLLGAVVLWVRGEARGLRGGKENKWESVRQARLFLGNYILLGLELMIVSDLVHSFLQPDIQSLYSLGLVVLIRTAISFFLGKELEAVRHDQEDHPKAA